MTDNFPSSIDNTVGVGATATQYRLLPLLMAFQFFNSGCVHTSSIEKREIEQPTYSTLDTQQYDKIQVRSVVYLPSKFPLEDFFRRMTKGEFTEAFKKIDLDYKASNTSDRALQEIIDAGFVPAYVEVKNQGPNAINIDEKDFILTNGKEEIPAFRSEFLPNEFAKFNPEAAAANVVNMGVVVVGFAAVTVAFFLLAQSSSSGSGPAPESPFGWFQNDEIFNDTTKITKVNYRSYLISPSQIETGQTRSGLLFFNLKNHPQADKLLPLHHLKISFRAN